MDIPDKPTDRGGASAPLTGAAPLAHLSGPAPQFLAAGAIGVLPLWALSLVVAESDATSVLIFAVASYALGVGITLMGLRWHYPHGTLGLCNLVTLIRLMLTCVLIGASATSAPAPWGVLILAVIAFALDGADGWLARRERLASPFGARFDVEVDAALALVLALHAYLHADVGAYVILLGLPRYLFVLGQLAIPWLNGPLPDRFSRKVVCALQISALILVILPGMTPILAEIAAGTAALALFWSFSVDLLHLWRVRP